MFLPCFLLARCSQWLLDYDLNAPSAGGECIVSIIRSNAISLQSSRNAAFLRIISILFLKGDIYNVKDLHIGFPVDRQHTAC